MSEKRKCLFTGKEADWLLQIGEDSQNWAKRVPCTREWYDSNNNRPLTPKEFRLVELFFQSEVAQLKAENFKALTDQVRSDEESSFNTVEKLSYYKPDIDFGEEMEQDIKDKVSRYGKKHSPDLVVIDDPGIPLPPVVFEPMEVPEKAEVVRLSTPKKDDKIVKKVVKKKPTLWD
jgi:hypothetical protein